MSLEKFSNYKNDNFKNTPNDNQEENLGDVNIEELKRENEEAKKEIYGIISEIEAEGSPFASDKKLQEKIEELEKKIKSYPRKCTRNSHIIHTLRNLFTSYGIGIRQRGDYRGYRNKKGVVIKEKEKRLRERKLDIKKIRKFEII